MNVRKCTERDCLAEEGAISSWWWCVEPWREGAGDEGFEQVHRRHLQNHRCFGGSSSHQGNQHRRVSLSWLPEMLLKSATTTAMIGCVVGKNAATVRPWNECNAQLYGLEERLKVTVHGGQRRVVRRELDVEIHVEEGCRLLATCMYSRNSMHSCLIWICWNHDYQSWTSLELWFRRW